MTVQRDSDEDAWRSIVENYGDRAELDDPPAEVAEPPSQPVADPLASAFLPGEPPGSVDPPELRAMSPARDEVDEERYVPPPPPPLPKLPPDRLAAWSGLFGSPAVLLLCLVLGISLPSWLGYLLVAAFVGGFAYLVVMMPRGGPADPWDDGARL